MYLYPVWVRLWHVVNAILVIILIITGISMQYSDNDNHVLIVSFASAVKWHNISAVILTISYIFFVTMNVLSGNGKYYRIRRKNFLSDLGRQFRYYSAGMFRREGRPFPVTLERKFNPLQKLTYVIVMYVALPLVILSGLGLMFPGVTVNRILGVNGLVLTDILHITMGFLISIFLIIHIYTCTLGARPTSSFRGIITGYQESDEE
jgi:thiosulfate reductase cytochrome b subunit